MSMYENSPWHCIIITVPLTTMNAWQIEQWLAKRLFEIFEGNSVNQSPYRKPNENWTIDPASNNHWLAKIDETEADVRRKQVRFKLSNRDGFHNKRIGSLSLAVALAYLLGGGIRCEDKAEGELAGD